MHHRRPAAPHSHRPNHRQINRLMPFTTAPLFHALQLLETGDSARFHMPGTRASRFSTPMRIFLPSTLPKPTAPATCTPAKVLSAMRRLRRAVFRLGGLLFSDRRLDTGILAMLGTAVGRGGAVLLDREVHKSVCYGCALLGITPYFFLHRCSSHSRFPVRFRSRMRKHS